MNIFSILTIIYLGSAIAKLFFIFIQFENENQFRLKLYKFGNQENYKYFMLFIITPFSSLITKHTVFSKTKKILMLSEIFAIISSFLFAVSISQLYTSSLFNIEYLIHFIIFFAGFLSLLYLSIFDIQYLSIPVKFTMQILFFNVVVQIFIFFLKYLDILENPIFNDLGTIQNILGFLILYLGTYLLIIITKEEGIGSGDADINGFVGLLLGFPQSIVFLFLTIFVGSIVGLTYAGIIGKLKGVIIPMVPLICIGYTIAIGFSEKLINLVLII